jgi:hypothetical protein
MRLSFPDRVRYNFATERCSVEYRYFCFKFSQLNISLELSDISTSDRVWLKQQLPRFLNENFKSA